MLTSLPVVNAETATFDCIFGRGCEGICCKDGRPCTYDDERQRINDNLDKFLPEMRPEAAAVARRDGVASNRLKFGGKSLRVVGGWCIFFNQGCVLHTVGHREGDAYKYKPYVCAVFPLHPYSQYKIRQWGYDNEKWDLFCLNPKATEKKATETLESEIALVTRYLESLQAEREREPAATAKKPTPPKKGKKPPTKKKAGRRR
jgi:hypothetical protein